MLGTEDRGVRQSHAHGSPDGRGTSAVAILGSQKRKERVIWRGLAGPALIPCCHPPLQPLSAAPKPHRMTSLPIYPNAANAARRLRGAGWCKGQVLRGDELHLFKDVPLKSSRGAEKGV